MFNKEKKEKKERKKLSKGKKVIVTLVIIVVVIVALVSVARVVITRTSAQTNYVSLQQVEVQDLSEYVSLNGTITGENQQNYASTASSEITAVNVSVGDVVQEGDILATLDPEDIQSQIDLLEKSIANANALSENQSKQNQQALADAKADRSESLAEAADAISEAQDAYDKALSEFYKVRDQLVAKETERDQAKSLLDGTSEDAENYEELYATYQGLVAEVQALEEGLDAADEAQLAANKAIGTAQSSYNKVQRSADQLVASAQNTIDMEQYASDGDTETLNQLDSLKKQLEDCNVKATSSGIVVAVNVKKGDTNTPGVSIITVENTQDMVMTASVDQKDILKLQEGMKAEITVSAVGDEIIEGEVIRVVRVPSSSSASSLSMDTSSASSGGYSVEIKLSASQAISGMTAKAKIILTQRDQVLCVPYDLVFTDEETGANYVLCAEQLGEGSTLTAVRKNVTVGEESDYYVEVLDGDVQAGDYIIMDYDITEGAEFESFDYGMDFSDDYYSEDEIVDAE